MNNPLTLEGLTFYDNEPAEIYSVVCPWCGYDRLELIGHDYKCLRCTMLFNTQSFDEPRTDD